MAMPSCLRLLLQLMRLAASRTFWTAGSKRPIKTAMMAITTSSSIRVKPWRRLGRVRSIVSCPQKIPRDDSGPTLRPVPQARGSLQLERFELVNPILDLDLERGTGSAREGSMEPILAFRRRGGDHLLAFGPYLLGPDHGDDVVAGRGALLLPRGERKGTILLDEPSWPNGTDLVGSFRVKGDERTTHGLVLIEQLALDGVETLLARTGQAAQGGQQS